MKPDKTNNSTKSWVATSQQTLYEYAPYLRLERQTVRLPDGKQVQDYHQIEMPNYCVICPFTVDGKIVMLEGYRHGIGCLTSFLPGGIIEQGENPFVAAQRELLEETGYSSDKWTSLGNYQLHGNYGCGRAYIYKAIDLTKLQKENSGDLEEMHTKHVSVESLEEIIQGGEIQSLSSVAAIALCMSHIY